MSYKTIIGLEIHAELLTESKIFCSCSTEFGGEKNTHCCPICLGLPGALPLINKRVIEHAIRAGLALNCNIASMSKMDRKNYFYPDLPKGYQVSQYDMPLCKEGYIDIEVDKDRKRIGINRIHIEEDAGKSLHGKNGLSLLDYNRAGVPLIEIVTKPHMNSSEEVYSFLQNLKMILEYIEVSDCKMEQGSLRCDANINVISMDGKVKSNIVEIKNLNSFKAVVKAIDYEENRHIQLLREGKNTIRETRRWDETKNITIPMRNKEKVEEYRYFPEPNIVEFQIDDKWIMDIEKDLPELPTAKKERFIKEYKLPSYDAEILVASKKIAGFFENVAKEVGDGKLTSNWIMTEILRQLKLEDIEIDEMKFEPKDLSILLKLIKGNTISNNVGKQVLREMFETGKEPKKIIKEKGLEQITDGNEIELIVRKVIDNNPQAKDDYKNGKEKALGFLVGQVMKETRGKADPQMVNKIILENLT